jgi:hypothetical protein
MSMLRRSLPIFIAVCIVETASCKTQQVVDMDDTEVPPPDNPPGSDLCQKPHSEQVAPMGGTLTITSRQSPSLAGTTLVVPVGALGAAATLQLGCGQNLVTADDVILGPSVRLSPEGQSLLQPVTLTLPYLQSKLPAGAEVLLAGKSGTQLELYGGGDINVGPTTVTAKLTHFGDYQVIARKPSGTPTKNVDVLFVMDNSPSMVEKQRGVIANIGKFLRALDDAGLDYQLGVVTSDVGSTVSPGTPWGGSIGSCDTFEGDDGQLQAIPCTARTNGTSEARNACATYCSNDRFVPGGGKRYISKLGGVTNVPQDLVLDPMSGKMIDNGPARAFQCMGLVGDGGCGIESPLEGARRALDGHRSDGAGFLRKDSLLAVVVLSDEDDCSVQMSRRNENNPQNRDCADPDQNASFDCYNIDYRCLARSVQCAEPMNVIGSKTSCKERPGNYLEPVSRYTSFFRGLRPSNRLVVAGLWALPSVDKGGKLVVTRGTGGTATPFLNRGSGPDAACEYMSGSGIFARSQLRLSAFANGITDAKEYSICDVDNVEKNLLEIAGLIAAKAKK